MGCKPISSEVRGFCRNRHFLVPLLLLLYLAVQGEDTRATHRGTYRASVSPAAVTTGQCAAAAQRTLCPTDTLAYRTAGHRRARWSTVELLTVSGANRLPLQQILHAVTGDGMNLLEWKTAVWIQKTKRSATWLTRYIFCMRWCFPTKKKSLTALKYYNPIFNSLHQFSSHVCSLKMGLRPAYAPLK